MGRKVSMARRLEMRSTSEVLWPDAGAVAAADRQALGHRAGPGRLQLSPAIHRRVSVTAAGMGRSPGRD